MEYEGLPRMAQQKRKYQPPQGDPRGSRSAKPMSVLRGDATEGTLKMKKSPLRVYTPPNIGTGKAAGNPQAAPSGNAGASAPPKRKFGSNPDLMDYMNRVTDNGGGQVGQAGARRKYAPPSGNAPSAKPATASAAKGPYKPSGYMDALKESPEYKAMGQRYGKKSRNYQKPKM